VPPADSLAIVTSVQVAAELADVALDPAQLDGRDQPK
jgi:hypothetical protein